MLVHSRMVGPPDDVVGSRISRIVYRARASFFNQDQRFRTLTRQLNRETIWRWSIVLPQPPRGCRFQFIQTLTEHEVPLSAVHVLGELHGDEQVNAQEMFMKGTIQLLASRRFGQPPNFQRGPLASHQRLASIQSGSLPNSEWLK